MLDGGIRRRPLVPSVTVMTKAPADQQPPTMRRPPTQPRLSPLRSAAALWSALVAAAGVWWLVVPGAYEVSAPGTGTPESSLVALLDPGLVSAALVGLGSAGVLLAMVGADPRTNAPARWVTGPAIAYAVVFGFLVPDLDPGGRSGTWLQGSSSVSCRASWPSPEASSGARSPCVRWACTSATRCRRHTAGRPATGGGGSQSRRSAAPSCSPLSGCRGSRRGRSARTEPRKIRGIVLARAVPA